MDNLEDRIKFYTDKVKRYGGRVIVNGDEVRYSYPTLEEQIEILKKKIKEDGKGELLVFSKRSGLDPCISYGVGSKPYYHRDIY